jgi:hypothetical protein
VDPRSVALPADPVAGLEPLGCHARRVPGRDARKRRPGSHRKRKPRRSRG